MWRLRNGFQPCIMGFQYKLRFFLSIFVVVLLLIMNEITLEFIYVISPLGNLILTFPLKFKFHPITLSPDVECLINKDENVGEIRIKIVTAIASLKSVTDKQWACLSWTEKTSASLRSISGLGLSIPYTVNSIPCEQNNQTTSCRFSGLYSRSSTSFSTCGFNGW